MTSSAAPIPITPAAIASANNKIAKIEKLQNIIQTGIFRPRTEYSRTSLLFANAKSARSAKFRTDILIEELQKLIRDLQEFLKNRLITNKYDSTQGADSILELKKKLDLSIIKYEIVQKLNVELNYARNALDEAIRHQGDIGSARKRAAWLEDKIESIILSQNEISFPMQAQLMNDTNLRVQRIGKSSDESKTEIPDTHTTQSVVSLEDFFMNQTSYASSSSSSMTLDFEDSLSSLDTQSSNANRDNNNKSVGSSDSILSGLRNESIEDIQESFLKFRRKSSMFTSITTSVDDPHKDLRSVEESNDYYLLSIKSKESLNDLIRKQKNVSIGEVRTDEFGDEGDEYNEVDDDDDDKIAERVEENNQLLAKKKPVELDLPHRRFEWSPYVKTLYALDSTTFHQLGISIRDSYIETDDEIKTDLPWLKNKKEFETEDYECLDTINRIETLYKKICKGSIESTLPHKKESFTPVLVPSDKEPLSTRAKRLIKSYKKASEDENSLPKKDDIRLGSTMSHNYVFFPHPITPSTPLPLTRLNTSISFPRSPKVYSGQFESKSFIAPRRLVNQRNLKEESKLNLYRPKVLNTNNIKLDPTVFVYESKEANKNDTSNATKQGESNLLNTIMEASTWKNIKPKSSPAYHDGLKFERIRALLSKNIKSLSVDERMDAARHLGLLRAGDAAVLFTLQSILDNKNEPELLRLECAKSLILLGCWRETVFNYMIKYLKYGNVDVQLDLLKTIIEGKNIQFVERTTPGFDHFNRVLEELTYHRDEAVSLNASICLGKLGIVDSNGAQTKLRQVIEADTDWVKKTLALEVYVKQFNLKTKETLNYVLNQLRNAPVWPSRAAASRLLGYLGPSICCTSENIESVYDKLEQRLCEDPIKEVRVIIGETMKQLQLYNRVVSRMTKNLESQDEDVRAKAVVALDTLCVKRNKVIQILVDMLELDGSDHVRILVIKTLLRLAPNDIRVKIAFDKLEKGSHLSAVVKKLRIEVKKPN